jgi:hypothetical protein
MNLELGFSPSPFLEEVSDGCLSIGGIMDSAKLLNEYEMSLEKSTPF